MTYPKISIIIHCFNRENYIRETLESIINQKYPNTELIVIDDGSTDKSWQVIQEYKEHITYMEQLSGMRDSPVTALNIGFSHSTGEIMGWLNTKNTLVGKSLWLLQDTFATLPQVEWLTGLASTIDEQGRIINVKTFRKNVYDYLIGQWQVIQQESTFWRRSLWERTGSQLNPTHKWSFDAALWVKFFLEAELYHVNTVIGTYRKNLGSGNLKNREMFMDYTLAILQELRKKVSSDTRIKSYIYLILYYLKPIIKNIPDNIYTKIPVLNSFYHYIVIYNFKENWKPEITKRNPFRFWLN